MLVDVAPPELLSLDVTDPIRDPATANYTLAVTARLTDDISGVFDWRSGTRFARPLSPDGLHSTAPM